MQIFETIKAAFVDAAKHLYQVDIAPESIQLSATRKEFEGDYTIVLFPYIRQIKKKPESIGAEVGDYLVKNLDAVVDHNTIKGFLNLKLSDAYWKAFLAELEKDKNYGAGEAKDQTVMVEFSSPNTNKPLHLGHVRNILLGWSVSEVLKKAGYKVINTQIVNDRGIAVCKSMLAWQVAGNGETPSSSGIKGDHFVGKYYVKFEALFQEEYRAWQSSEAGQAVYAAELKEGEEAVAFFKRYKNTYFNTASDLGRAAKEMLLRWEAGEPETVNLWRQMNGWVYDGFGVTYDALGVSFDKLYYESDTYLLGKEIVEAGLDKDIFYRKDDGSVWIDLEDAGMDQKLVLRSDGTSVYITQDIGTAQVRYQDFGAERMVYVVADEQDYHFKVLFEIAKRLGEPYAEGLYHLSYGMVDLPSGRMKSREGTVVDADDLIAEVIGEAEESTRDRGEIEGLPQAERDELHRKLGLGALKFFLLKVQPKKRMTFDPKSSVDMQGQTGPYIQYAYVRVQSMLRKAEGMDLGSSAGHTELHGLEVDLLKTLAAYPATVADAADQYDPSVIANYCYGLAKQFSRYFHDVRILSAESDAAKAFRLGLSAQVARVLADGMHLLGINMPDRM